jgi:uncharacterized coiled-coil DUF342 family protein
MSGKKEPLVNSNKNDNLIKDIHKDVDSVKDEMKKNIKQVINNRNDLQELKLQAHYIKGNAADFEANAVELKEESQCITPLMKKIIIVLLIFIALLAAYFITAAIRCKSADAFCS